MIWSELGRQCGMTMKNRGQLVKEIAEQSWIHVSKFEKSESQGKILHSIIKKYSYSQSKELVDVLPLVEQIEQIKSTLWKNLLIK